jgi:hypothetical protein
MKTAAFWSVAPCRYCVSKRFGGKYLIHLQGIRYPRAMNQREQVAAARHPGTCINSAYDWAERRNEVVGHRHEKMG